MLGEAGLGIKVETPPVRSGYWHPGGRKRALPREESTEVEKGFLEVVTGIAPRSTSARPSVG